MMIELPRLLNLAGLILGIVGVLVIFKWGPPMPGLDDDSSTTRRFAVTPTPHSRTAR
jgi:hypothetical protein